jgi:hypothetical protein
MGKTWHLIICYSKQTKTNSLSTAIIQKRKLKRNTLLQEQRKHNQNKNTELPPAKRFVYRHIARIHTLFIQDGQV